MKKYKYYSLNYSEIGLKNEKRYLSKYITLEEYKYINEHEHLNIFDIMNRVLSEDILEYAKKNFPDCIGNKKCKFDVHIYSPLTSWTYCNLYIGENGMWHYSILDRNNNYVD